MFGKWKRSACVTVHYDTRDVVIIMVRVTPTSVVRVTPTNVVRVTPTSVGTCDADHYPGSKRDYSATLIRICLNLTPRPNYSTKLRHVLTWYQHATILPS